jgi:hypothetical protein
MDILFFLGRRLDFIQRFYDTAAGPFETTKRKIEVGEEPYVPRYQPGDYDGFEYEIEWQEAEGSLRVLGQCCLVLVAKALQDYLREFIVREAGDLAGALKPYEGNWLEKYCAFLGDRSGFDWAQSPVARDRIEQINLCRIDIVHDPDIDRTSPRQSEDHFRKYPVSLFADELELVALVEPGGKPEFPSTINVTRAGLAAATEDVRRFCTFVEEQRTHW